MQIQSEFTVSKWEEQPLTTFPQENPLVRASVIYEVTGEINGKLYAEYLMQYSNFDQENPHNSKATYLGYMLFEGKINDKSGTFVIEEEGEYTPSGPESTLSIKPHSGTSELANIAGNGYYRLQGDKMVISFEINS